ncbi:MAG: hypothetical protein LBB61_03140 [Treponema sp.]|jgi:hypothetical protein|nr:hypothetical protein [Treponema sp.]
MAHRKEYIPTQDAKFDPFFKNVNDYVDQQCTENPPRWTHIPEAARTELAGAYADWHAAWLVTLKPHTAQETAEKNRVRASSEKTLRAFVKAYLRYHPAVTNEDRDNMGIPNDDTIRTPVPRPTAQVEADVTYPGVHLIEISNIRTVKNGEDNLRSDYGVRIFWGIMGASTEADRFRLAAPPVKGDDLPHSTFTHHKRYLFDFDGDSGKTVYFCLRYENAKGGEEGEGPFGPILSAIIP